jgi:hypothetical protein
MGSGQNGVIGLRVADHVVEPLSIEPEHVPTPLHNMAGKHVKERLKKHDHVTLCPVQVSGISLLKLTNLDFVQIGITLDLQ